MNWDRVEGNWKQFTGKAKEQWGKLTDDELTQINGNREQLEGKIQAKYGYAKDKAKQEVDDWCNREVSLAFEVLVPRWPRAAAGLMFADRTGV
jgi:uncharacterized protein YjbJ (UPF0337 family)